MDFDAIMAWSSYSFSRVLDSEIDVEQEIKVKAIQDKNSSA